MFRKTGIEVIDGWHARVLAVARESKLKVRDVYMVAIDLALDLPLDELKLRARVLRAIADDDPDGFQERTAIPDLAKLAKQLRRGELPAYFAAAAAVGAPKPARKTKKPPAGAARAKVFKQSLRDL